LAPLGWPSEILLPIGVGGDQNVLGGATDGGSGKEGPRT